jgi:hypothetical protein
MAGPATARVISSFVAFAAPGDAARCGRCSNIRTWPLRPEMRLNVSP